MKKGIARNFTKFTGKHLYQSLFFNKKETLAQMFPCELCEISQYTFFTEHLWTTASVGIRVTSRVVERLKTQNLRKLGNISRISELGRDTAQSPVSPPEMIFQQQLSKIMSIIAFYICLSFFGFLLFAICFCQHCIPQTFLFWLGNAFQKFLISRLVIETCTQDPKRHL